MIENPFEKRKNKKLFKKDTSSKIGGTGLGALPRKFNTPPTKVSNVSSLGSEEEMLKALATLGLSGEASAQRPELSSQTLNPNFSNEFKGKWGVPFGNQPTGNPLAK